MSRYLGNVRTKEVHDLLNTKPQCQIEEIVHRVHFDSLLAAHAAGYDNCLWCIGNSTR